MGRKPKSTPVPTEKETKKTIEQFTKTISAKIVPMDPFNCKIMGLDKDVVTDEQSPFYDPDRIDTPIDEDILAGVMQFGILQPILAKKLSKDAVLVAAGRQRVKTMRKAWSIWDKQKLPESDRRMVPVIVCDKLTEEMILRYNIITNTHQIEEKLTSQAAKAARYVDALKKEIEQSDQEMPDERYFFDKLKQTFRLPDLIAAQQLLAINKLDESVKRKLDSGEFGRTHALRLVKLDKEEQKEVVKQVEKAKEQGEKITVDKVTDVVTKVAGEKKVRTNRYYKKDDYEKMASQIVCYSRPEDYAADRNFENVEPEMAYHVCHALNMFLQCFAGGVKYTKADAKCEDLPGLVKTLALKLDLPVEPVDNKRSKKGKDQEKATEIPTKQVDMKEITVGDEVFHQTRWFKLVDIHEHEDGLQLILKGDKVGAKPVYGSETSNGRMVTIKA